MAYGIALVAGLVAGLVAAAAFLVPSRQAKDAISGGLAGIVSSFVVLTICILLARFMASQYVATFGIASVLTFLAAVTIMVLLGKAQGQSPK